MVLDPDPIGYGTVSRPGLQRSHSSWHWFQSPMATASYLPGHCFIPIWWLFHARSRSSWHWFQSPMATTSYLLGHCFIPIWWLFHARSHSSWHWFQSPTATASYLPGHPDFYFNHDSILPTAASFSSGHTFIPFPWQIFIPSAPLLHTLVCNFIPHSSYFTCNFIPSWGTSSFLPLGINFILSVQLFILEFIPAGLYFNSNFIHNVLHSCHLNKQNKYLLIIIVERHFVIIVVINIWSGLVKFLLPPHHTCPGFCPLYLHALVEFGFSAKIGLVLFLCHPNPRHDKLTLWPIWILSRAMYVLLLQLFQLFMPISILIKDWKSNACSLILVDSTCKFAINLVIHGEHTCIWLITCSRGVGLLELP